jgi:MFS family permease
MSTSSRYTATIALFVALGGFLMGFDASVISGVVGFIEVEFSLTKIQVGWSVSSLALTATLAMMLSGPLSDRIGRRPVLRIAALLFAISAIASALAPSFYWLVVARMLGGLGVGAALIIAPMYIAEMAPPESRGRLVSFNQLNIVIGISVAFFSNYLILTLGESGAAWTEALRLGEWNWRWMLGVETLPAVLYLFALLFVPESPRWLAMRGRDDEAREVLERVGGSEQAARGGAWPRITRNPVAPVAQAGHDDRHLRGHPAADHRDQRGVLLRAHDLRAIGHRHQRIVHAGRPCRSR